MNTSFNPSVMLGTGISSWTRANFSIQPEVPVLVDTVTPPAASAVLTLSGQPQPSVIYSRPLSAFSGTLQIRSGSGDDAASAVVLRNQNAGYADGQYSLAGRIRGLGSALLERFKTTASNYQYSAVNYQPRLTIPVYDPQTNTSTWSSDMGVSTLNGAQALSAFKDTADTFSLKIHTRSGAEVRILVQDSTSSRVPGIEQGLGVEVQTQGTLTPAEQQAIAKLAQGFEAALQGLGSRAPQVNIAGLADYDTSVLSGVDLTFRSAVPYNGFGSFDFHANASQRSVHMKSQAGDLSVKVDLTRPALWGSAQQRQTAVKGFLDQFGAATRRGHGNPELLSQFSDSFAQLHTAYPSSSLVAVTGAKNIPAQATTLLTGLADFQANMGGDFNNGSMHHYTTEAGHFDYRIDQQTLLEPGKTTDAGLLTQTQNASLTSKFKTSLHGNMLDVSSGNYATHLIQDEVSSTLTLAYAKSQLTLATLVNAASLHEHHEIMENFKVVVRQDTLKPQMRMRNLLEE